MRSSGGPVRASIVGRSPGSARGRSYFGLAGHGEVGAAVARPALLGGLLAERDLLAVGHGLQAVGGDAQRDQVVVGGLGAPLAEGQVVLDRAALVAVALDGDAQEVELLQGLGVLGQDRRSASRMSALSSRSGCRPAGPSSRSRRRTSRSRSYSLFAARPPGWAAARRRRGGGDGRRRGRRRRRLGSAAREGYGPARRARRARANCLMRHSFRCAAEACPAEGKNRRLARLGLLLVSRRP